MKKIYLLAISFIAISTSIFSQNVNVSGALVGNGTYPDLGSAFTAINGGAQTGATILVDIVGNTIEPVSAVLNQSAGPWTSLTISPSGGASRTISGAIAGHMIDLNGADNVTIDGLNSGGNFLFIDNSNGGSSTSTIRFTNDASNNTIIRTNINGSAGNTLGTGFGVIYFATGTVTGNDNNTISICNITASSGGTPLNAIYSFGSSAVIDNSNNTVTVCNISDFFSAGTSSAGMNINSNNSAWTITNNSFYQTATRTSTASNFHYGVFISNSGSSYTISNNIIGGGNPSGGGTAWTIAGTFTNRFTGIAVAAASTATTSIQNNTILNFSANTNSSASTSNGNFSGIWVSGGNANIGTITGNTIGSGTGNGSINVNLQTNNGGIANLISYSGTGTVAISNNIIGSVTVTSSTAAVNQGCQAILVSGGTPTITNNTIGSTVTANSINSSSVTTSNTNTIYGINVTSAVTVATTISGNTIANLNQNSTSTASLCRGMIYSGTGFATITNNVVRDLSSSTANVTLAGGATGVQGICYTGTSPLGAEVSFNQVYTIRATNATAVATTALGIGYSNPTSGRIFKNRIYDIRNASTMTTAITPPVAAGIMLRAAPDFIEVSNNMISLGNAQTTNTEFIGIWNSFSTAATIRIYYNTVRIEGVGAVGALPTFAFLRGSNAAVSAIVTPVDIRNNIFDNARTGGAGSFHYAIGNVNTVPASGWGVNASNNNVLNAIAANIGFWTATQTFAGWKTASASDPLSVSGVTTTYLNTATADLHLNLGVTPTQIESGGVAIAGITTDYDNQVRPGPAGSVNGGALAPDMGADEFDGVPLDLFAPTINYALLLNNNCTTTRTFTATITDNSGINSTVGTRPRVYYKRFGDANTYVDNTNATNGWKYVEASNAASPFNFTIDYSLVFGGGVVVGDNIQYFVTAQDLAGTPNVAINSGTFAVTPATVALTAAAFPIGGTINSYNIVTGLATSLTVGALGTYPTLTGAGGLFSAINANGLTGNTTVNILDASVTETGTFALNQIQPGDCSATAYTLLIKPNAATTSTLTGTLANNALIRILSSNVTIDGSNNGTATRDLTITNTSLTSPSVLLIGSTGTTPVVSTTLKNSIIINGSNGSSAVVISDGATLATAGYFNNITIQNNSIQLAFIGVYSIAVPVAGNGSGLLLTQNDLNTAGANSIRLVGLYAQGVDGGTISNNNIGNMANTVETANISGMFIASGSANFTITGNNISAISGTVGQPVGIRFVSGVAAAASAITGNSISALTSAAGVAGPSSGILVAFGTGGITINRNNITNIKNTNAGGWGSNGIQLSSTLTAANINVHNNFISDVASFGFAGNALDDNGYGIFLNSGGGYNIRYNSVNMNTNQTAVTGLSAAINISSGVATAGSVDMRNNIFNNSQTAGSTERYAIYSGAANTVYSAIDFNDYFTAGPNLGFIGVNRANLAAIQAGFGGNTNSLNVQPNFTSATDLHLVATTNCGLDGYGTPIAGITTDYDNAARDATTPDMGADEFSATYSGTLAGIVAAAVCENKTVSATGTTYATSVCDLIARVVPTGGSPIAGKVNVCVTRDAAQQYFNGEPYVQRHYDIEPATGAATATATVILYFTNQDFVNYNTINSGAWPLLPTNGAGNTVANRNNVRVTQFHGTPTGGLPTTTPGNYTGARVLINPGFANVIWNGTYWEVTIPLVTGFSGFYLHSTQFNLPLPIIVNYLTGRRQGSNHLLNWKVTCASTPRATMTLERSSDARNYSGIYTIAADAARCQQPFDYTDASPLIGMNYYRLRIVDADGRVTYSTAVALLNAVKGYDIISIAPNPVVTDNFKLNIASAQAGKMEISIFDMQGRLMNRQSLNLIAGFNSMPVNVANLSSGTYTIRGSMADDQSKVIRFVKQ